MLRYSAGAWEIEVHHDLEGVVRSWEERSPEVTGAVLHVGFERRVARTFEEVADQFPGRVILTTGAKGALPNTFRTSAFPIAEVSEEPVFLALEGWGYREEEPLAAAPAQGPAAFLGWVGSFVGENPDVALALLDRGIVDEASYLAYEDQLERDLRRRLGVYRSTSLLGGKTDDPCEMARTAPPWLAAELLSSLDLTVRIANVFRDRNIETVADLQALTPAELRTFSNFGRTSIHHLSMILQKAVLAGPPSPAPDHEQPTGGTLLESVRATLAACPERERDILTRRMGLDCEPETLQQISESYGITRERVRQIEQKVTARLVRKEVWDDILATKLKKMLTDREFPLPLIGAEALDPWFAEVGSQRTAVRYLIANMCATGAAVVEIADVEYLSFLSREEWQQIVSSARHLLAGGVGSQWSTSECERYVAALLPDRCKEFGSLLWQTVSGWCHFADDGGGGILTGYGRGADHLIEAVLQESETPLHYHEIALRAANRASREVDERRAHSAAAEVGYLFGPGTYGLLKHLSVTRPEREIIADEAAEIVLARGTDRQWHTSELLDELRARGVDFPQAFDKYQLDIALKQQGLLAPLGRMVWASSQPVGENARVEVRQAVIALLQQAGRPLTQDELRQRLIAIRGINQGMQFAVQDPIIKLDPSTWALNDRDISVKRSDQPAFLDGVVSKLQARGSGVHIGDCSGLLGAEVPPRALFCLAASDPRMHVTPGRFLVLREWSTDGGLADGPIRSAA
jgi:hypothetical protein